LIAAAVDVDDFNFSRGGRRRGAICRAAVGMAAAAGPADAEAAAWRRRRGIVNFAGPPVRRDQIRRLEQNSLSIGRRSGTHTHARALADSGGGGDDDVEL